MVIVAFALHGQSVIGKWKSIDDDTGKARSIVEIYEQNGKVYGKIIQLFRAPEEEQNPVCRKCDGAKHNQPIIGMVIIEDMVLDADDNEYEDGTILDPESGTTYDCKIWLEEDDPDVLNVRGYVAFLWRTQEWKRVK